MPGLNASLYLGLSGLQAQQSALSVVGQNIANVNTPGYTRQRADLSSNLSLTEGQLYFGTGVSLTSVQGIRDRFLDLQIYRETAKQSGASDRFAGLNAISTSLADTGSSGIGAQVQAFFQGFQDLSAQPESAALRTNLVNKAQGLISALKTRYQLLEDQRNNADQAVGSLVTQVNTLTDQIASLNQRIMTESSPGANNDARDQRKALTDKLSALVGINVFEGAKGEYQITLDSGTGILVNGTSSYQLSASPGGALDGKSSILLNTEIPPLAVTSSIKDGQLGARLDLRDNLLPGLQRQLDQLAAGLVQGVNQLHRTGYAADGITTAASAPPHPPLAFNNYFFVGDPANASNPGLPTGVDFTGNYKGMVSSLAIDPNIVMDSSLIAAAGVAGAKGDNANALAMAALQTAAGTVDLDGNGIGDSGTSYSNVIGNLISDVGNKTQLYETQTTAQQNLLTALQNQRDSISGVNLDEEASSMMTLQRGYQASARFISVINQLTDQLVNQFGR